MLDLSWYQKIFHFEITAIKNYSAGKSLMGYKLVDLSLLRTFKIVGKSYVSDFRNFRVIAPRTNVEKIENSDIFFIIEYRNHYNIFKKLQPYLNDKGVKFLGVIINPVLSAQLTQEPYLIDAGSILPFSTSVSTLRHKVAADLFYLVKGFRLDAIKQGLILNSKFFSLSNYYTKLGAAISTKNPKPIVFFRIDGYKDRSIALAGKQNNSELICIQHGSVVKHPKFSSAIIDEYLSWSDHFSGFITGSGAGCKTIAIGSVEFDELFEAASNLGKASVSNKIKLLVMPPSGKSLSLASDKDLMIELAAGLDSNKYLVTLKPHPEDDNVNTLEQAKRFGFEYLNAGAKVLFENFDFVVLNNSTSGIEAAIFKKPLILISASINNIVVKHYLEEGVGIFATNSDELKLGLSSIENNYETFQEKCQAFTENYLTNHGNATEKVAEYLSSKICVGLPA
ncbi:MAG: hypothetical protein Q7T76_05340 [Ferruginibacter sp.]|nr:hypothetical protein [Ferruginibacter sp.]